jgi:protein O-GlcNAc transferase
MFRRLNRKYEAAALYRKYLSHVPDDLKARYELAHVLKEMRQFDKAVEEFRHSTRLAPDNALIRSHMGHFLSGAGRWEEAVQECREAARLAPRNASYQDALAAALTSAGHLDEAVAVYRSGIDLDPLGELVHMRFDLGQCLQKLGRWDEAVSAYQETINAFAAAPQDPSSSVYLSGSHGQMGVLMRDKGNITEALDHLSQAVEIAPEEGELHYEHGIILEMLGRHSEAWAEWEKTLSLENREAAAQAYVKMEQKQ